jgi:predicted nucleic acid-binding protein
MARLVLSDASPLIVLARVSGLSWLRALFGVIVIPETVRAEILDRGEWPGMEALSEAIDSGWLLVHDDGDELPEIPQLDEGEAACIRLALRHDGPRLILIDERVGRAIAGEFGIQVAGTAAVIGQAKQRGLIPSARAVFEELLRGDFRLSREVIQTVLAKVGELE